jgi:hypothetical protein
MKKTVKSHQTNAQLLNRDRLRLLVVLFRFGVLSEEEWLDRVLTLDPAMPYVEFIELVDRLASEGYIVPVAMPNAPADKAYWTLTGKGIGFPGRR